MTEWFEQWFGEEYHELYLHRDEEDARRAVALVRRMAPWRPGERVLDLACGAGRHAAELERLGATVVGFDPSRPGGRFVLDYLNGHQVRATLKPAEEIKDGPPNVRITRRVSDDGRYVVKEIELRDDGRGFQERVRLFSPNELAQLLVIEGLEVVARYGDYDGAALDGASPRAILVAVRREQRCGTRGR